MLYFPVVHQPFFRLHQYHHMQISEEEIRNLQTAQDQDTLDTEVLTNAIFFLPMMSCLDILAINQGTILEMNIMV